MERLVMTLGSGILLTIGHIEGNDSLDPPLSAAPSTPTDAKKSSLVYDLRTWTGKNGAKFIGNFEKEDGDILHIRRAKDGKLLKIAKKNLHRDSLAWYEAAKTPEGGVAAAAGYHPIPADRLDRSAIPVLNQSDYGTKASDCVPNSFAAFFLWWDQGKAVPITKGRDFEAKAQWIHRELSKRCGTRNNSGTSFSDAAKGIREYFHEFHEKRFKLNQQTIFDISPASLAKHATGSNATVLSLSTYKGKRIRRSNAGAHAVTLMDAQPDGRVTLTTWGFLLKGKMVAMEDEIPKDARFPAGVPRVIYEIVFDEDNDVPKWFTKEEYRFVVDPSNWDQLEVLSIEELKKE